MIPPRWVLRIGWAIDKTVSRLSGGRLVMPNGSRGALSTLYLNTVGRTSGKPRRNGLYYLEDDADLVVIASNAGEQMDPAWLRNLRADPRAEVELGTSRRSVLARVASPAEAGRLYERFVTAMPVYDEYRQRVRRDIPVVILEPTKGGRPARSGSGRG